MFFEIPDAAQDSELVRWLVVNVLSLVALGLFVVLVKVGSVVGKFVFSLARGSFRFAFPPPPPPSALYTELVKAIDSKETTFTPDKDSDSTRGQLSCPRLLVVFLPSTKDEGLPFGNFVVKNSQGSPALVVDALLSREESGAALLRALERRGEILAAQKDDLAALAVKSLQGRQGV